ncbi:NAD-dependent epimerase/dehydratase family protein [Actinacidiphila glaucinigra]|uniref:NAD-dependent epimerase/dehydratase family protein n=1 Tax=Actinacidiphila glaucinigra TaxID=235986 RepID=UPI003688F880
MKVFVIGGAGYLGRATIQALTRRNLEVSALVRSEKSAATVAELGAEPVRGTLTDADILTEAAHAADGVIHLGEHAGPDSGDVDRAAAQALQDGAGSCPYVHTGGAWVYGDTDGVVDEDAPLNPPRLTVWRLENEKRVLARAATGDRPVVVMPGVVYGHAAGLIDIFYVGPGRADGAVPVIGEGTNRWSVVHVDDIADLYTLALAAPAGSVYAGVIDVYPTEREISEAVSRFIGRPGSLRLRPWKWCRGSHLMRVFVRRRSEGPDVETATG